MLIFLSAPVILLLLLALALFTKRTACYKANALLASGYVSMAYALAYSILYAHDKIADASFLAHSNLTFFYLACPCLYVYMSFSTGHQTIARGKLAIHLLPVLPGLVYFICDKLFNLAWNHETISQSAIIIIERIIHGIGLVTLLVYLFLAVRLIASYGKSLRLCDNGAEQKRLYWLKTLLPLFILTCFILFLTVAEIPLPVYIQVSNRLLLCLLLTYLFVKQFHVAELFFETGKRKAQEQKYANSSLSHEQLTKYSERLTEMMKNMSLYLKHDLCIEMVAAEMCISHHQLSQVVNQKFGRSFPEYVNHYRIAHAKKLLNDPVYAKLKSSYIAGLCGFKTRENFSCSFKKITGISLAQYMQDVKLGVSTPDS